MHPKNRNIENRINSNKIENYEEKYNIKRKVITNPIDKAEQEYKIEVGDILIVLARYEEDIYEARKVIKSEFSK